MQTTTAYYLTQKNRNQRVRSTLLVMIATSAACTIFIAHRLLTEPFSLTGNIFDLVLIVLFIAYPVYGYRRLSKQAENTKLEITDTEITLIVPPRPALSLLFTDIKLIDKTDHGLVLVPVSKAGKVIMISNKFDDFAGIEARINQLAHPN